MTESVVSTEWLGEHLGDDGVVVADVRWRPAPAGAGHAAYLQGHLPGAVFVDLDTDLADVTEDAANGGRHPLPSAEAFCERLAAKGIGVRSHVVCCDDMGGGIAARLWWMLRWVGHARVSVLDGGLGRWIAEERKVEVGEVAVERAAEPVVARPAEEMFVDKRAVGEAIGTGGLVLDARAGDRYRGEGETLDPVGGHIVGAHSAPFAENLDPETTLFCQPTALRERFRRLGVRDASEVICHCGSGVTACHNILAMELAGLGLAKLYVGSWSEWCRDPKALKGVGPKP